MNLTRDLFYSEKEKILFSVAGYTDNTENVNEIIQMYEEGRYDFANIAKCDPSKVRSTFINISRRYKYMRVFYCHEIETPPKKAFLITNENGWTMHKWLSD